MDALKYWDHVTMSMFGDANQRVVEKILHLHVMRNGLRVKVLKPDKWTTGMMLPSRASKEQVCASAVEFVCMLVKFYFY